MKTDFDDLSAGDPPPNYYVNAHWTGWTAVSDNTNNAKKCPPQTDGLLLYVPTKILLQKVKSEDESPVPQ